MFSEEYLTSNAEIAFPFRDGQVGPEYLFRIFADASVASDSYDVALTKAVYSMADMKFEFKVGATEYSVDVEAGPEYVTVSKNGSCFVLDMSYLNQLAAFDVTCSLRFEPSCVVADSKCVGSISVYNGTNGSGTPDAVLYGDVDLLCGNNVELSEDGDGNVVIEASPGSGLGVVPCEGSCDDDVNTDGHPLVSDDGHVVIAGDGCYEITSEVPEDGPGVLKIHGKCVACCQCQMYVDAVNDLKDIAKEVAAEKEKAEDRTDTYFDLIDKYDAKVSVPEIDVQLDISPDSSISEAAYRGKSDYTKSADYGCFRVTCTLTNLSGLPCCIAVRDKWQGDEYNEKYKCNGIVSGADNGTGLTVDKYIDTTAKEGARSGWLVYSHVRGPRTRKNKTDKEYVAIEEAKLRSSTGWPLSSVEAAVEYLSSEAESNLNSGKNPSDIMNQDSMMLLSARFSNGIGFVMPPGYSFTITNMYALPSSVFSSGNKRLRAMFNASAFVPMVLYECAYNSARPRVYTSTDSDGHHTYKCTWVVPSLKDPDKKSIVGLSENAWYDCSNNTYGSWK